MSANILPQTKHPKLIVVVARHWAEGGTRWFCGEHWNLSRSP